MPIELKSHFVAFIDILGFSEMVRSDCESAGEPEYLQLLFDAHQEAMITLGQDIEAGLIQFSDSIVFSKPFDLNTLNSFISAVAAWQKSLLLSGLLCRGGITFGKHFVRDRFMFSKGLIDAYQLESAHAKYPRILISNDLLELASTSLDITTLMTVKEEDSAVFVDYLAHQNEDERLQLIAAIGNVSAKAGGNASVQEKIRWLTHYSDYRLQSKLAGPKFA